ncbi:MAG: sigma 54-interacting transcriptional regulator [Myxococcaceae bacterium]|nr:sigma 54-interacting transcriptional regulator [Myxococcaceae bacterium]
MSQSTQSESVVETNAVSVPVPGAILIFSGRAPQYRPVVLPRDGVLRLGREDIGGLPVPDEKVSRQHAEVTLSDGDFQVKDLGSRNGTWVDGARVEGTVKARSGAVVRLAQTVLLLEADLRRWLAGHVKHDDVIIGPTLQQALDRATVARATNAHLLVRGESGAGKELVASRYHEAGARKGPFVAVNCAAIPASVAERLFFGAVKGAYTEAKQDAEGYLAAADGGVLFLDEIAELDLQVQAKLLRALETGEYLQLGAATPRKASVHVVAASHRDLRTAVAANTFRSDLFYRLSQFEVLLPPLRERKEEVPWLMRHALSGLPVELHATAVEAALVRPWPGNVRELLSETRKAAAAAQAEKGTVLRAEHLAPQAGQPVAGGAPVPPASSRASVGSGVKPGAPPVPSSGDPDREAIMAALAATGNNVSAAAKQLDMHRTQLYRVMKRLGLFLPDAEEP